MKATGGSDGVGGAAALSFLMRRAHMVLFVYPLSLLLSTLLEGIAKTNHLEMVGLYPGSIVDVFEVESGNESGQVIYYGTLNARMSVFDFGLPREIQICFGVLSLVAQELIGTVWKVDRRTKIQIRG